MFDQTINKLGNIKRLSQIKLPCLFFGLAVWVVFPIVGIFPLLLSVQLDLLKFRRRNFLSSNNLVLLIVVLTITIYSSSIEIFGDTENYLEIYRSFDYEGPFENYFSSERYEFLFFIIIYPIFHLTNGSTYWCLFLFSLLVNSIVVFYISKNISAKYYPTCLILLFSNYTYYSQLFYMRQFLSIVLVMAAVASINYSWYRFFAFSVLAIFSHLSTAVYVIIILIIKIIYSSSSIIKINWQKNSKKIYRIALGCVGIILPLMAYRIYTSPQSVYEYISILLNIVPQEELSTSLQQTVDNYDGRDTDLFVITIYRALPIIGISIFTIFRKYGEISPKKISLIVFFLLSLLQIIFIQLTGFNQRIVYLFLVFFGFFFSIGLDEKNKLKPTGFISLITVFTIAATTYNFINIQSVMNDKVGWSFFNGKPLSASLWEYLVLFWDSL